MKKFLAFILLFFCMTLCSFSEENQENTGIVTEGVIQSVEYIDLDENDYTQVKQQALVRLKGGEQVIADNMLTGNPYYDINLRKGMHVMVYVEEVDGNIVYSIEDVKRSGVLVLLSALFCALLVYVGRKKGLYSIISIGITCVLIYNLLSPMILFGINPVVSAFLVCILSTALTMYLVGGLNKKSTAAICGCLASIVVAGLLALITVKMAHLTGFCSEHTMYLYSAHPELNFVSIAIAAILLATLGAVMDVAMSIASTINEINCVDSGKSVKELFTCGMNVGRDIIGTMANTLILVYIGGALPLLLLASNIDMQKFINLNQVVTEIASALIGSCAIVVCVPITAIIASVFVKKHIKEVDEL